MMSANVNQVGFERRLARVKELVQGHGLQASNISPLAYDEKYTYPYNNFLFKVELAEPALASTFPGTQPGTCKAPSDGVSVLVVKLSNPAARGVNNANRVANDVAAQQLVRQSMAESEMDPLIPNVYAWAPATATDVTDEKDFGWIMSELRNGVDLDTEYGSFDIYETEDILKEMAGVFRAIRFATLPEGVTKFGGGLKFDENGQVVSGESPRIQDVKPAGSYAEWRIGKLRAQFEQAAKSPVIEGWKYNGVSARIEAFLTGGGPEKLLADVNVDKKCLIHGDLTMNNILFDKKDRTITAVLDFDFASVCHPYDEFISMSFSDIGIDFDLSINNYVMEEAILSGDFKKPADEVDEGAWEVAKMWYTEIIDEIAPSCIDGVRGIHDLMELQELLCPDKLRLSKCSGAEVNDEERAELRAEAEADLVGWLKKHEF